MITMNRTRKDSDVEGSVSARRSREDELRAATPQ